MLPITFVLHFVPYFFILWTLTNSFCIFVKKTMLNPILHNELSDIQEVALITKDDSYCLSELKEIILKYGKENKFGISLLHTHFDLLENEMLVETINVKERVLTTTPVQVDEQRKKSLVQTVWCFSKDQSLVKGCESFCPRDDKGRHKGYKDHYS